MTSFRTNALASGRIQAANPALVKEGNLNDAQARALESIAAATLQEVEQQDARARRIIDAFRAQYPNGIVPKGKKLPEPPPELKVMQEERNAMILRGRDRLRAALGEQEFARFHQFAMRRFAAQGLFDKEQR